MLFWKTLNFSFCQSGRSMSKGSIPPYKTSKHGTKKKLFLKKLEDKTETIKERKKTIKRTMTDEIESLWLDSLTCDNLKLYRKTSFGSFRRVNNDKLLDKLRAIYPTKLGSLYGLEKSVANANSSSDDKSTKDPSQDNLASPYVSDFLIRNMMNFPLLKSSCEKTFKTCLKDEREDFGLVDTIKYPSVTRILSETASEVSKLKLKQWRTQMIEKLGEEGFFKYQKDPTNPLDSNPKIYVETRRKRKQIIIDLLTRGAQFHGFLKQYLQKVDESPVTLDPAIEGCWTSLEKVLPAISNVKMVEETVIHPVLMYRGIVDCVASYRDVPCVIEWKKSDKTKSVLAETYDAPLQLCAYLGALAWRPIPPLRKGLVVVAYTTGAPAKVFTMDMECCQVYWMEWLRRLQTYWVARTPSLVETQVSDT